MSETIPVPERVAIVKPCCIGDCVMALPAIDSVGAHWPDARIDLFVGRHSSIVFSFRPEHRTRIIPDMLDRSSALRLASVLRRERYDAVICLDRSRWLRLATYLARPPLTAHVRSRRPELRHESEVYLDVARALGTPTPFAAPVLTPLDAARDTDDSRIPGLPARFAVLHPGGALNPGAKMLDKRWPAERFGTLARNLVAEGCDVLLSGGDGDRGVAIAIAIRAGIPQSQILAGRVDLGTLTSILARAALYVGPDTGVSHIAAAVGTPTVVIFGPTNPRRYRPIGPRVQVVAPAASWSLPDRDLRRSRPSTISTELVSVDDVLAACHRALNCTGRGVTCSA